MSTIRSRMRSWLIWSMPFVVIALLIGWETDWGRALKRVPALESNVIPRPVNVALLPEYKGGGLDGNRETVERTLFNPTRRPAPPTVTAAAKSSMQKGQFVLTGTTVVDKRATAFLREVNGGRSRRVQQGETVNGMLVAEVRADRVKLTLAEDAEELTLKVASGPRATVQPVVTPPPGAPVPPGQPGQPVPNAQAQNAQAAGAGPVPNAAAAAARPGAGAGGSAVGDVSDVLANRRRAVRDAQQAAPGTQPAPGQPGWSDVYQRYVQPRK